MSGHRRRSGGRDTACRVRPRRSAVPTGNSARRTRTRHAVSLPLGPAPCPNWTADRPLGPDAAAERAVAALSRQAALRKEVGDLAADPALAIAIRCARLAATAMDIGIEVPAGAAEIGNGVIGAVDIGRTDEVLAVGVAAAFRLTGRNERDRAIADHFAALPVIAARGSSGEAAKLVETQAGRSGAGQAIDGVDRPVRHRRPTEDGVCRLPAPDVGAVEVGVGEVRAADIRSLQIGRASGASDVQPSRQSVELSAVHDSFSLARRSSVAVPCALAASAAG
jgi:hypothetical protein